MKRNQAIILSVCGVLLVGLGLYYLLDRPPTAEALARKALTASNLEEKKRATLYLVQMNLQSSLIPLRRVAAETKDPEVLVPVLARLGSALDTESLPLFLDDMDHSDVLVRETAYGVVLKFFRGDLPENLLYDWEHPPEMRRKVIRRLKEIRDEEKKKTEKEELSPRGTPEKVQSKDQDKAGGPK